MFADRNSVFANKHKSTTADREDHRNPHPITRAEEEAAYHVEAGDDDAPEITKMRAGDDGTIKLPEPLNAGARQMVARFDKYDRPWVAHFENGKQVSDFKPADASERKQIKTRGKVTAGGLGVVDDPATSGFPIKKVLIGGVVVVGLGAIAWWIWKKNKADDDADVSHVRR